MKHKLKQAQSNSSFHKSSVEVIIDNFCNVYDFADSFVFESLRPDLQIELVKRIEKECSKYVVGALFVDTHNSFYGFSKKNKLIQFNPNVYAMIVKFKCIKKT